jgi:hypothetical protein
MTPRSGVSLVVAGGLLLAGCGAARPEQVAVNYVATNAASKCELLTQSLVEQLTHEQGAAARATCRRNVVRYPAPADVVVRRVKGDVEAESEVLLVADGHEAEVRLVKQHEHWQIAALGE